MNWLKKLRITPPPARKGEVNFGVVDRFTLVHMGIGCVYGAMGLGFGTTIFLAVIWEILENPFKVHFSKLFPHATADTIQNLIGDTVAVLIGWGVVVYWGV